jgi:hypothetical protein
MLVDYTSATFATTVYDAFSTRSKARKRAALDELVAKQEADKQAERETQQRVDAIVAKLVDAAIVYVDNVDTMVTQSAPLNVLLSDRLILQNCIKYMNLTGTAQRVIHVDAWIAQRAPAIVAKALEHIALRAAIRNIITIPPNVYISQDLKNKLIRSDIYPKSWTMDKLRCEHASYAKRIDVALAAMVASPDDLADAFVDADAFVRLVEPMLPPRQPLDPRAQFLTCPNCIGNPRLFGAQGLSQHTRDVHPNV